MIDPNKDGIDHINIYSKGKTKVGRWLSNFTNFPITIPPYGDFNSIEGFWYWLQVRDDRLKELHGFAAKKLGRDLKEVGFDQVENFEEEIKKAVTIKLEQATYQTQEYLKNPLPLMHYYVYGDKVIHNSKSNWLINHIEIILLNTAYTDWYRIVSGSGKIDKIRNINPIKNEYGKYVFIDNYGMGASHWAVEKRKEDLADRILFEDIVWALDRYKWAINKYPEKVKEAKELMDIILGKKQRTNVALYLDNIEE